MSVEKKIRLMEFLKRLSAADPVDNQSSAYQLLEKTLDEVENELSGIPYGDPMGSDDGRMYAPRVDSIRPVDGRLDLVRYRSRLHNTYISSWGAILIRTTDGKTLLDKLGDNNVGITLP
jgi:hypothetical protein